MSALKKILVRFKTKELFNERLALNEIPETSICFIEDTKEIWTHGQFYATSNEEVFISNGDEPTEDQEMWIDLSEDSPPLGIDLSEYVKKDGINNVTIRQGTGTTRRAVYDFNGLKIIPGDFANNTNGLFWKSQDDSTIVGGIGAVTNGDNSNDFSAYMTWGPNMGATSNSLLVGQNVFKYKDVNVTLSDGSVPFASYAVIQNDSNKWISFKSADGTEVGYIGYMKSTTDGDGMWLRNQNTGNTLRLLDDGRFTYKGNDIWHAGNDGEGSGLDADTLDGYHINNYQTGGWTDITTFKYENNIVTHPWIKLIDVSNLSHGQQVEIELDSLGESNFVDDFRCFIKYGYFHSADNDCSRNVTISGANIGPLIPKYKLDESNNLWIRIESAWNVSSAFRIIRWVKTKYEVTSVEYKWDGEPEGGSKIMTQFGGIRFSVNSSGSRYEYTYQDLTLEEKFTYWYENNENQSTTTCNRGGNRNVIESLRSKFKRCIAKPYGDDAALISFCNESNSNMWPDGSQVTIDGGRKENRMTYFPRYYHKTVEMSSGVWRTYISEMQLDDDYIEEPEMLLSTFEAYNNNGVLYSGSGLTSTANQTIVTFVTQAKANGPLWGIGDYRSHATIARMFCAYYGTTNISTANSSIPCSGGTKRYNYGKTGGTLSLGNVDGKAAVSDDTGYYSTNFLGLEDCYYSKWEFVQGVNVLSGKWVVYDGGSFPDKDVTDLEAAGATNIRIAGNAPYNASAIGSGWIKKISHGRYGDVVPTELGGSDSTYYADYYWYNTGNRMMLRSGYSDAGSHCGVFFAHALSVSSSLDTHVGSRLAFYGKIVVVDSDDFKKTQA